MPLPLIPLVVAGAAAASTAIASKKGYTSYKNMKETKTLAGELESKYKSAFNQFESSRFQTNHAFEQYGKVKLEILDGTMKQFVDTFKQIKHVNFQGEAVTDKLISSKDVVEFVLQVEKQVVRAGQVMTAGIASLAGGGLAALGAVGATATFSAASTGTAIATLSGIAAQNATLAFLGGGSLAAGGLGIAGGTLVLGGIALAPALAIGSLIFAASTEKKLKEMYAKKAEVDTEVQKLNSARSIMSTITSATNSMRELAQSTKELMNINVERMAGVIELKGTDFREYSTEEQMIVHQNYKLAIIMRDLLNTSILNEEGELSPDLESVMAAVKGQISTN